MESVPTLSFSNRARADIGRITLELNDLQRQTASGKRVDTLQGLGAGATRVLSAAGLIAMDESRQALLNEVTARVQMQTASLQQSGQSMFNLAASVRNAAITGDGRFIGPDLEFAFSGLVSGMNQTFNGQAIFGGERVETAPVKIGSLSELASVNEPEDMFDVSTRRQRVDLGPGAVFDLGELASDISWPAFQAMRDLKQLMTSAGGSLGSPLTPAQSEALIDISSRISTATNTLREAEARAGLTEARAGELNDRFERRVTAMRLEVATLTESDLAEVALRLAALQTQYEATAQTFAQLSRLTLLDFLR